MIEERILFSETPRLWVIPGSSLPFGSIKLAALDHIEDDKGLAIEELPLHIISDINRTRSSEIRTVLSKKKDRITAFFRYLGNQISFYGVVNQDNMVVKAFLAFDYHYPDVFLFYDSIRQLRVFNTLVSYDGYILLEADGGKLVCSDCGYHLFLNRIENNDMRWKIFTPDFSIIDVEVPYSEQSVNRGFDHGILLLGSTLIKRDGKVILRDVHNYQFHEDFSIFKVEDEDTFYYNQHNDSCTDSRCNYWIAVDKEGTVLYGVNEGDWDSYKLIDNYLLEKDLKVVRRTGIANPDFSILLPMCFEYISSSDLKNPCWWIVKINGRYGILSKDCKSWIIWPIYNAIEYDEIGVFKFSDSFKSGLMNIDGEILFHIQDSFDESSIKDKFYLRVAEEYPGIIFVTIIDNDGNIKSGVISQDKGEIIPLRDGWINICSTPLRSNRFVFRVGGEYDYDYDYDYDVYFNPSKPVLKYKGGLVGLIDEKGKVVLEPRYSRIKECLEDNYPPCYLAKIEQEWILFDFNGEPLTGPCTFISWYKGGFARFIAGGSIDSDIIHESPDVKQQIYVVNGRFGLFSFASRRSTGPVYDYIGEMAFSEGKFLAEACLNGRWGTINGRLEFMPTSNQEKEVPVKVVVSEKWVGEEDRPYGYTPEDLENLYRDAYEGDPEAQWNTD